MIKNTSSTRSPRVWIFAACTSTLKVSKILPRRASSPGLLLLQPERAGVHSALQPSWVSFEYGNRLAAPAVCAEEHRRDTWMIAVLIADGHDDCNPRLRMLPQQDDGATRFDVAIAGSRGVLHDRFVFRAPDTSWRDVEGRPIEPAFTAQRLGGALEQAS